MASGKKVLIAIPAFNEADNIEEVLNSLVDYKADVLVVNDGSSDNTSEIVKNMGVKVISHKHNLGLSAAYNTMFGYADRNNYTHMVTFDGDGQHDTSYVPQFIEMLSEYDFVAGNRFHSVEKIPISKLASNFFAVMLTRVTFGITLPDVACGFRAMKLNQETKYIHSLHYGVVYEMLFNKLHANMSVGYVNIPATYKLTDPLVTRIAEISTLMGEIIRYNTLPELKQVVYNLFMGYNFEIEMEGYLFKGEYIDSTTYRISTDTEKAKQFYRNNFVIND
ncbi:MAG: glycosyltransferase family 2 protein [Bacteroidota bacterium]